MHWDEAVMSSQWKFDRKSKNHTYYPHALHTLLETESSDCLGATARQDPKCHARDYMLYVYTPHSNLPCLFALRGPFLILFVEEVLAAREEHDAFGIVCRRFV